MFLPQARKSLIIIDNQAFHHVSPNFSNSVDDSPDQTVDRIKIEYHLPILTIHHTPTRLPFRPFPLNIFLFLHKLTDLYTPVQKTSVIPETLNFVLPINGLFFICTWSNVPAWKLPQHCALDFRETPTNSQRLDFSKFFEKRSLVHFQKVVP